MNGHLPECPAGYVADLCTTDIDPVLQEPTCNHCVGQGCICICNRLRTCEQRVEEAMDRAWTQTIALAVAHTRTATLDAAREAVVALKPRLKVEKYKGGYDCCGCSTTYDLMEDALAAIDALREEKG